MIQIRSRYAGTPSLVFFLLFLSCHVVSGQAPEKEKVIAAAERAFEKAAKANAMPAPGCAVGVSLNGESVFEKAFGFAEMEHNVPNTAQTIFESGSVAKQFTAAALVLLEQDGKLKLDDDVRKYIPELPEYGKPITIRHLLTHTAGLRDWGAVMALTGAGRGDRVINQDLAFDVITRQKGLDFAPGAEYSYSNSGYQLAAIIAERVSGQKFEDLTRVRIFKPLGMTNTSWRVNYQRLVPGRAQAYSKAGPNAPWILNMPFMNVVGNGGMLTTIGDWLKWNAVLDARTWNPSLVDSLETQGMLNDGRKISYALGLVVNNYRGMREVSHGGSTAGYQTFLTRYPDRKVSVAVLCNGTDPDARGLAVSVVDEIFGPYPAPSAESAAVTVPEEQLRAFVGIWRDERTRNPVMFTLDGGILRLNGAPVRANKDGSYSFRNSRLTFKTEAGRPVSAEIVNSAGDVDRLYAEQQWTPAAADLREISGDWYSEEAQAEIRITIEGERAYIVQRPSTRIPLQPRYKDHFSAGAFVVWLSRDKANKLIGLHIGGSRMRNMPFVRK